MRKCRWENGADSLSGCRVSSDPRFIKIAASTRYGKPKSACTDRRGEAQAGERGDGLGEGGVKGSGRWSLQARRGHPWWGWGP